MNQLTAEERSKIIKLTEKHCKQMLDLVSIQTKMNQGHMILYGHIIVKILNIYIMLSCTHLYHTSFQYLCHGNTLTSSWGWSGIALSYDFSSQWMLDFIKNN